MILLAMVAATSLFAAPDGQAVSSEPLATPARVDHPPLKPGLWTLAAPDCRFNLRNSLSRWPRCAAPLQIGETALSHPGPDSPGEARRYRYAPGDPGILQVETGLAGARAWSHFGFRPMAVDADGFIIRARIWPAPCPAAGCRVRSLSAVVAAARRAEASAFSGAETDAGRTAVWARRSR